MDSYVPEKNPIFHRHMLSFLGTCLETMPQTPGSELWNEQRQTLLD